MKRNSLKTLPCTGCETPTPCGSEASRVLCSDCALAGKTFPRGHQQSLGFENLIFEHGTCAIQETVLSGRPEVRRTMA